MRPVYEPGKIAAWLAPPRNGINGQPLDYESRPLLTLCPLRPHPRSARDHDFGAVGCTASHDHDFLVACCAGFVPFAGRSWPVRPSGPGRVRPRRGAGPRRRPPRGPRSSPAGAAHGAGPGRPAGTPATRARGGSGRAACRSPGAGRRSSNRARNAWYLAARSPRCQACSTSERCAPIPANGPVNEKVSAARPSCSVTCFASASRAGCGLTHTPGSGLPKPAQVSRVRSLWRSCRRVSGTVTSSDQPAAVPGGRVAAEGVDARRPLGEQLVARLRQRPPHAVAYRCAVIQPSAASLASAWRADFSSSPSPRRRGAA